MIGSPFGGVALAILAGAVTGTVLLPMKYVRGWKWENTWLVYSVCAYLLFPLAAAWATIPKLWTVWAEAGASAVWGTVLFGFGWGLAVVMYGVAIDLVGLSLTSGIILGSSVAIGSLVPLLMVEPARLRAPSGRIIVAADFLMLFGVVLCAWAGDLRDKVQSGRTERAKGGRFVRGLVLCLAAGVLSTLFNVALAYGRNIPRLAMAHGASEFNAANAVWGLAVTSGSLPSIFWSLRLLRKNQSWQVFRADGPLPNATKCVSMAVLWIGGTVLYGAATGRLGLLGPAVGWPIYMSSDIIGNNFWGWFTGEWRGVRGRPIVVMLAGIAVQVFCIAWLGQVQ